MLLVVFPPGVFLVAGEMSTSVMAAQKLRPSKWYVILAAGSYLVITLILMLTSGVVYYEDGVVSSWWVFAFFALFLGRTTIRFMFVGVSLEHDQLRLIRDFRTVRIRREDVDGAFLQERATAHEIMIRCVDGELIRSGFVASYFRASDRALAHVDAINAWAGDREAGVV